MKIAGKIRDWLGRKILKILLWDNEMPSTPFCDFERIQFEIRPGDVLLVEGRSRISEVIKTITLSRWTHAALFIGRPDDIEDQDIRNHARNYYPNNRKDHLLIEALAGKGAIISPLSKYQYHNIRICRPRDLSPHDVQEVIKYAVGYVGMKYNVRQLLDLGRFFFPYGILPRRWRSSLFEKKIGDATRTICSTMLAEAFASVQFPVLPFVQSMEGGEFRWFRRNSSLFVPSDFDYSPYFDVIKYPFFGDDLAIYRKLPWDKTGLIYSAEKEIPKAPKIKVEQDGQDKPEATGVPSPDKEEPIATEIQEEQRGS